MSDVRPQSEKPLRKSSSLCPRCGVLFYHTPSRLPRYCGMGCYNQQRAEEAVRSVACVVPGCGKEAAIKSSRLCWAHYTYTRAHGAPEPPPEDLTPIPLAPTDAGWIAGILDGEGCLSIYRHRYPTYMGYGSKVAVANTCTRMISHLHGLTGLGGIRYCPPKGKAREQWAWVVQRRGEVKRLLVTVLPYLITKREQARLLLEFPLRHSRAKEQREKLYEQVALLNHRGRAERASAG